MTIDIQPATAGEVRPLRNLVLRDGRNDVPDWDSDPTAVHIAARDGDVVVGCATVFPDPYDDEPLAWHLRGMAVAPDRQGEGIGRLVLQGVVEVVRAAGGPLIWANARATALGFYERLGWQSVSEEFSYGQSQLPHRVVILRLPPGTA